MQFKNVSKQELDQALETINKKYDGNVIWNNPYHTLRVQDSHGKGARKGYNGKHFVSACWHVHGDFFEALLKIQPKAIIKTVMSTVQINEYGQISGNWLDKNIGSIMNPLSYSEACECGNEKMFEAKASKELENLVKEYGDAQGNI